MHLEDIQKQVDHWIKTIGVRYFSELTNNAILMEEVGELSRIISRKYGEQSFKNPISEAEINHKLGEEMADVLFVLCCLANQTGIDLQEAFNKKLKIKTERDINRHKNNEKLN